MRRCFVTRESEPTSRLVRFVAGPDGAVVPDVAARLPGRGLWLRARGDIVARAVTRNAFARGLRAEVRPPADLPAQVEALLARRCLALLGMARRAGAAVAGAEKAAALLRSGRAALLLSACDGSARERERIAAAGKSARVVLFSGCELGGVFGRDRVGHVAVAEGRLARELLLEAARLAGFRTAPANGELDQS